MAKSLILEVKAQVGVDVVEAFMDMIDLAQRMQMMVTTDFNGVHCYVWIDDTVEKLVERYHYAVENKLSSLPYRVPQDWRPEREW